MADEENWEVRGCLDSEQHGQKRFKYGHAKVGARLETRRAILYLSLTADGRVYLRISRPGEVDSRLVLFGRLEDADGAMRLNPSLAATGLAIDQEYYEQRSRIGGHGGGRPSNPERPRGPARLTGG